MAFGLDDAIGLIISIAAKGGSPDMAPLDRVAASIWVAANHTQDMVTAAINDGLRNNLQWNDVMTNNILARVEAAEYNTSSKLDTVVGLLNGMFNGVANSGNTTIDVSTDRILRALGAGKSEIIDVVGKGIGAVIGRITTGEISIGKVLDGIDFKLDSVLGAIGNVAKAVADAALQKIDYTINNEIRLDSNIFDVILGRVNESMREQIGITGKVIDVFDQTINTTFADALNKQTAALNNIATAAVRGQASPTTGTVAEPHRGADGEPIKPASPLDNLGNFWDDLVNTAKWDIQKVKEAITYVVSGGKTVNLDDDPCMVPLFKANSANKVLEFIAQGITYAIASGILPIQMAQVQSNRLIQKYRTCFPDQVLSPPELRAMYHLSQIDKRDLMPFMNLNGYSKGDADLIMKTWETVPDITLLFSMYFRGLIKKNELEFQLKRHGFSSAMVDNIVDISTYLPPVQDLITMSVRDVFDANTVAQNRQNEDYPPEFTKWMAQQGVSKDWAEKYWQAHWRLPSETMGFEMFHRDIIDETRLKSLMKSLDIMPGWRDQLLKLSYSPLTRVDVRRMHSVGVLSEAEVNRAYRDIGYSPENAQRLTDFTVRLNEGESVASTDVAADLTKSQILSFYEDGIITRQIAEALLLQAGVNIAATELLIHSSELKMEQSERKQLRTLIMERFRTGRYTFEQAVAEAQRLDFSDRETESILLALEIQQAKEYKLPPRADLDRFVKKGLVDKDAYVSSMMAQGFTQQWAEVYYDAI